MFKKVASIFLISFFILCSQFVYAAENESDTNYTPLVKCGHDRPCTICDLIIGIKGVIDYLTYMLVIVGLFIITVAGIIYIVSSGDSGLVNKAKGAIQNTLIGIVIVLSAWVIIILALTVLSAKDISGDGVSLTKTGAWSFQCSTESNIGGSGGEVVKEEDLKCDVDNMGCSSPGKVSNLKVKDDKSATWNCTNNGKTISCEKQAPIPDGANCGSGVNSQKKPAENELCKIGTPNNLRLSDGRWYWVCVYVDENNNRTVANCSSRGKVDLIGSGYSFDTGIKIQQTDASEELIDLLECMNKAGLSQSARRISSISDTNESTGKSVYDECSDNWSDPACDHKKNSCHYGGENCKDKGSMAVDFGNEDAYAEINKLAKNCGASYVLNEGDHVHVSIGSKYNCGCN